MSYYVTFLFHKCLQHYTIISLCNVLTCFRITELEEQQAALIEQHSTLEERCVQAEAQKVEIEEKLQQLTQVSS